MSLIYSYSRTFIPLVILETKTVFGQFNPILYSSPGTARESDLLYFGHKIAIFPRLHPPALAFPGLDFEQEREKVHYQACGIVAEWMAQFLGKNG
jgi:hypothetical protein